MEKERKERCKEKIELAERRIGLIEETAREFDKEKSKLACYKAFQEVIESITDILAMILIEKKKPVSDDYTNIEKIKEIVNFSINDIAVIKEANGLRNRIVHKYNRTDDEIAKQSIIGILPKIESIIKKIKEFIENDKK